MWRTVFTLILLPSLTAAQTVAQTAAQSAQVAANPSPQSQDVKPRHSEWNAAPRRTYQPYTFYDNIRRGTAEEVAVEVFLNALVATPKAPLAGVVPLNLELQPEQGFTFSEVRYPKARKQKVSYQSKPVPVAGSPEIRFKLHAAADTPVGLHVLRGRLTFQPIDATLGTDSLQQVDVEIPINVVEHSAKVNKQWPYTHLPIAAWVVLIALSPVLIALWLPLNLICTMAGSNGCL